jgi:hypothetical protein
MVAGEDDELNKAVRSMRSTRSRSHALQTRGCSRGGVGVAGGLVLAKSWVGLLPPFAPSRGGIGASHTSHTVPASLVNRSDI